MQGTQQARACCQLCHGAPLLETLRLGEFRLEECSACGCATTLPQLPESDFATLYPPAYYGRNGRRFNAVMERLVQVFRRRRADAIERFVPTGRMVDIGCGRGVLPAILRARGWDAYGVEASSIAAAHAESLGISTIVGTFPACSDKLASFDVAVLWHVLEHLRDPRAAIRACHELLNPNGLLAIAVPNYSSLQSRLTRQHWFHLDVPRHFFHFPLDALKKMLEHEGFTVLQVSHFSLEQNPYGWLQSLLNALGFRQNLLYDILKRPEARSSERPLQRHPWQTFLTVPALLLLAPLSLGLFLLEVLLRSGGTVEIYARRQ